MRHFNVPAPPYSKALPFLGTASAPPPALPPHAPSERAELTASAPPQPQLQLTRPAILTHDIRNALCSLELLTGFLAEPGVLDQANGQFAADLKQVSSLLRNLFEQLIAPPAEAAADGTGPATVRITSPARRRFGSANEALLACNRLLRTVAGTGKEVHISAENDLPPLALSDDLLLRVLMNLVKNSSEAMAGAGLLRGVIRITGRRAPEAQAAVLVCVSDNGPGIAAQELARIFEPGFTTKQRSPTGAASGLGLPIVCSLVEGVGGEVRVASTRRSGTTFELRIPCL